MSSTLALASTPEEDYVYQQVYQLSTIINKEKLTNAEVAKLFKYFTKNTNKKAEVEKALRHSQKDVIKLMYLRKLLTETPVGEIPSNVRIQNEDLGRYWSAIKALEINEEELFLDLPNGIHILGNLDKPSTLLIRKCYKDLATVVLDDNVRRIRITGNLGIGKTFFGYYLLYLLAQRGRIILYESVVLETSYIFDGEATFRTFDKIIIDTYKSRRDVWYIVDGIEPKEVNAKTILICFSKKSHYANFDNYCLTTVRYMPVWSLDEIHACRNKMFPSINRMNVNKLFSLWGGIPRFVLERANDYVYQQRLKKEVELCGDKIFDCIYGLDASPEISHAIIHLWTNLPTEEVDKNTDENADGEIEYIKEIPYTQELYYFASDCVSKLVTEKFKQNILEKLLRNIEASLLMSKYHFQLLNTSNQFLDCCFKQIAHRMLQEGGTFKVRSLEPDFCQNEDLSQTFTRQEDILTFSEIKDIEDSKYYLSARN